MAHAVSLILAASWRNAASAGFAAPAPDHARRLTATECAPRRLEAEPESCQPIVMIMYEVVSEPVMGEMLPINALRNAALLPASTPLVTMMDVDLLISRSLAEQAASEEG